MGNFFERLSYSFGNEDWRTEQMALKIQPQDSVLCITASGDRPLNLLTQDCRRIVSIDANPNQNQLLKLKMGSLKGLNFEDYLQFLGAVPSANRINFFPPVIPYLDEDSANYWSERLNLLSKGILYQGEVEKLTKVTGWIMSLLRRKKIRSLMAIRNLDEQRAFVKNEWDRKWLRKAAEFFLSPSFSRFLLRDPGLENVGQKINPGAYLYQKMNESLHHSLACQNPLFSLIFTGKVQPEGFPPYLTKEGAAIILGRLDRLRIHNGEVVNYLESLEGPTFDCFSFSDIASYMDEKHFRRLLTAMHRVARPGARFCIRQFFSLQTIPDDLKGLFSRDHLLEQRLEKEDRCFVYRFFVGTVIK